MPETGTDRHGRTHLAARRLGKPEGPFILQGVFDGEVVLVVEDGDDFVVGVDGGGGVVLVAARGDWDGGEVDLLSHLEGHASG